MTGKNHRSSCERLLAYQVLFARPYAYLQRERETRLLGFAVDNQHFILQEITVHHWFSTHLFTVANSQLFTRSENDRGHFHARCFQVVLNQLMCGLEQQQPITDLFDKPDEHLTFRYPFDEYTVLLHCSLVVVRWSEFLKALPMPLVAIRLGSRSRLRRQSPNGSGREGLWGVLLWRRMPLSGARQYAPQS